MILCLLQNQWFRDPERAKKLLLKYHEHKGEEAGRNRFIRDMLFMGCLTGKRIKQTFGEEFCWDSVIANQVTFEEVSTEIGGHASSCFPPDLNHVLASLKLHKPGCIVTFGKIAQSAISGEVKEEVIEKGIFLVHAPHPAARGPNVMQELKEASSIVHKWMEKQ